MYIVECGWSTADNDHNLNDTSRVDFYRKYIGAALYCKAYFVEEIRKNDQFLKKLVEIIIYYFTF